MFNGICLLCAVPHSFTKSPLSSTYSSVPHWETQSIMSQSIINCVPWKTSPTLHIWLIRLLSEKGLSQSRGRFLMKCDFSALLNYALVLCLRSHVQTQGLLDWTFFFTILRRLMKHFVFYILGPWALSIEFLWKVKSVSKSFLRDVNTCSSTSWQKVSFLLWMILNSWSDNSKMTAWSLS